MQTRGRMWVILGGGGLALLALLVSAFLFRAPILRGVADAWIVNEELVGADAIVLLGGGLQSRPFEVARLYRDGYAPVILLSDVERGATDKIGLTVPQTELMRQVLLEEGVPEDAIVPFGNESTSTYDESMALGAWARASGARRVIVPTDVFHTRRVDWFVQKALAETGTEVVVRAVDLEYARDDWWKHEDGLVDFQSEVIKFVYYLVRY